MSEATAEKTEANEEEEIDIDIDLDDDDDDEDEDNDNNYHNNKARGWSEHELFEEKLNGCLTISKSKIAVITELSMQHANRYKDIVHLIEKFIRKGQTENDSKLPQLFMIDSICRADLKLKNNHKKCSKNNKNRKFVSRFGRNISKTFHALCRGPESDKCSIKKVFSIWHKQKWFDDNKMKKIMNSIKQFPNASNAKTHTHKGTKKTKNKHRKRSLSSSKSLDLDESEMNLMQSLQSLTQTNDDNANDYFSDELDMQSKIERLKAKQRLNVDDNHNYNIHGLKRKLNANNCEPKAKKMKLETKIMKNENSNINIPPQNTHRITPHTQPPHTQPMNLIQNMAHSHPFHMQMHPHTLPRPPHQFMHPMQAMQQPLHPQQTHPIHQTHPNHPQTHYMHPPPPIQSTHAGPLQAPTNDANNHKMPPMHAMVGHHYSGHYSGQGNVEAFPGWEVSPDQSLMPMGRARVLSCTIYVGFWNEVIVDLEKLKQESSIFGRVLKIMPHPTKPPHKHCFVQFTARIEAENAKSGLRKRITNTNLHFVQKVGWGRPPKLVKETFKFDSGIGEILKSDAPQIMFDTPQIAHSKQHDPYRAPYAPYPHYPYAPPTHPTRPIPQTQHAYHHY